MLVLVSWVLFCLLVFPFGICWWSCSDFLHGEKNSLGLQSSFSVIANNVLSKIWASRKFTCWEHSRIKEIMFWNQIYKKCPFFEMNSTKSQPSASFYSRKQPVWCWFFQRPLAPPLSAEGHKGRCKQGAREQTKLTFKVLFQATM